MFYYKFKDKILFSETEYPDLVKISENTAKECQDTIYVLNRLDPGKSRRSFSISDPSLMFIKKEGLDLLKKPVEFEYKLPEWLVSKIYSGKMMSINTEYPEWQKVLHHSFPLKWTLNVIGLGDVGGTLVTGLRLLGGDYISKIGIYGRDRNKIKRWEYETNQILVPSGNHNYPDVHGISEEEIFNCDMLVFCASAGVPPVGEKTKDVRMVQFEANSRIITPYARKAREKRFRGVFALLIRAILMIKAKWILRDLRPNR